MKQIKPTEAHLKLRADLIAVLHQADVDALEMLAILAHLTGQVIAMQDQRCITFDMALEIVSTNLNAGNKEMVENLMDTKGNA